MEKEDIRLWDFMRIIQGEAPLEFYVEILIRGIVLYIILIMALRLMGKRMALRMNRNELAAISTLAAAVGMPMQSPDRGLLPALLIAGIVVVVQRAISWYATKKSRFERQIMGKMATLIREDGLDLDKMRQIGITRERLFSEMRTSKIRHLGEVQRIYMEASGAFTLIKDPVKRPGLCILPNWDSEFVKEQPVAKGKEVCGHCGNDKRKENNHCTNCEREEWVTAIL